MNNLFNKPLQDPFVKLESGSPWRTADSQLVHGWMEFPRFVKYIIDNGIYQRMRNIKQMGLSQYVYTSAVHTRFAHSLGTGHLALGFLKQLMKSSFTTIVSEQTGGIPLSIFSTKVPNQYSPSPAKAIAKRENFALTVKDVICIITAALCHDLGHPAFSHTFEIFAKKRYPEWSHETGSNLLLEELWKQAKGKIVKDFARYNDGEILVFSFLSIQLVELHNIYICFIYKLKFFDS